MGSVDGREIAREDFWRGLDGGIRRIHARDEEWMWRSKDWVQLQCVGSGGLAMDFCRGSGVASRRLRTLGNDEDEPKRLLCDTPVRMAAVEGVLVDVKRRSGAQSRATWWEVNYGGILALRGQRGILVSMALAQVVLRPLLQPCAANTTQSGAAASNSQ